ncbi:MAG: NAD(P)-dependent oxidoreductase [Anaerolineae bacterium]|nr:NAD(P)-dependent oxidoreductase [Phycisphaerae bacterium]
MIIVDKALAEREAMGRPIRVGLVGAGFAGKGFALQLLLGLPGLRLVAISNRTLGEAEQAVRNAQGDSFTRVTSIDQLETAIAKRSVAVTSDAMLLCAAPSIDVIVEATGEIDFAARVCMAAFDNRKHAVVLNAELDATLGPILKYHAKQAGVMYCQADGDQPAVLMNLHRYVKSLGFEPVLAGNIKSLQDCRRTPTTQAEFAKNVWQRPKFITSFADGTKISQEMATVANATGFRVGQRGMYGPRCTHVDEAPKLFKMDELLNGGLVDYILGAQPSFGVFILGYSENPIRQKYMKCYKMGDGPLYTFYTPFHLSPLEAPNSVARAVLFGDAPVTPLAGPVAEVITIAKRSLKAGEKLDGIGGYLSYGTLDNADTAATDNLLPIGLSEGCTLLRDLPMDAAISFNDVAIPQGRLSDKLFADQRAMFGTAPTGRRQEETVRRRRAG